MTQSHASQSTDNRPFVIVNKEKNPQVVIRIRTKREISAPSIQGAVNSLKKTVSEKERLEAKKKRTRQERGWCIRQSEGYKEGRIRSLIDELRDKGYDFVAMVPKDREEHVGRHSEIFHVYEFHFMLSWHMEMQGIKIEPTFSAIKGQAFTLLENLLHDKTMYAMEAYANPVVNGETVTSLSWLCINIVDWDAYEAKKKGFDRSANFKRKYSPHYPKTTRGDVKAAQQLAKEVRPPETKEDWHDKLANLGEKMGLKKKEEGVEA